MFRVFIETLIFAACLCLLAVTCIALVFYFYFWGFAASIVLIAAFVAVMEEVVRWLSKNCK